MNSKPIGNREGNKKSLRTSRPAVLSDALLRRINTYALAAGAAGVAALACAPQAEAAPVCKTLSISISATNTIPFNPAGEKFPPFQIAQTTFNTITSGSFGALSVWNRGFFTPNSKGANVLLGKSNFPAALASGASIGPGGDFGKGGSYGLLFTYGVGSPGNRRHGTLNNHFGNLKLQATNLVGFQFSQNGNVHYGWARLQITLQKASRGKASTIHYLGWGYESTPNTAITAGSCSAEDKSSTPKVTASTASGNADSRAGSLGTLALGAK
jgi:hypothetical protein